MDTQAENSSIAEICYLPIQASTYKSVSVQSIGKTCLSLDGVDAKMTSQIQGMVSRASPGQFDNEVVRARVVIGPKTIYINKLGEIFDGEKSWRLEVRDFKELERMLDKLYDSHYR